MAEDSQVEVVVVVRDAYLPGGCEANSDGEVGHSLSSNLTDVVPLVVKDLDTVGPVVADEDLHVIVDYDTVGELEEPGAAELVEDVANHVEDDDPHDLALHHNDPATVVCGHAAGMLENVGPELSDELSILCEDLNLNKDV